ncbi:MAG: hypothetical protein RIC54_13540 [Thalassobaculum sp.]
MKAVTAAILFTGLAAAPALQAHEAQGSDGSKTMPSMMGQMMDQKGGMPMMDQMTEMMKNCNAMMQAKMEKSGSSEDKAAPEAGPSTKS